MTNPNLTHLLGNFKDKYEIATTVPEPELSLIIKDLVSYEPHYIDLDINKNFPVAKIWLALISNPNLTEEGLDLLYPKLFNPNIYSISFPAFDQKKAIDNILSLKFVSVDKIKTMCNFIWTIFPSSIKATFSQNFLRKLGHMSQNKPDAISGMNFSSDEIESIDDSIITSKEELYNFFFNRQKHLIECASGTQLLGFKNSAHKLKAFLNNHLVYINPHLDLVKSELKKRKHSVPSVWKNYSGANFDILMGDIENKIYKLKTNRKEFLRQLKNRVLSPEQIAQENLIYLTLLEEMSQIIENQKKDISAKLNSTELKVPDSPK